ncbi:MAG: LLM class flavin-dependent oxidoreductase [Pseudomonadota bacterium]
MARRRMYFNAFTMNCIVHQSPGLWTRDDDHMTDYKNLDHWLNLAKLLERGKFDGMFLADVLGTYDVYSGTPDPSFANAIQAPVNDPMLLVPAMATVTDNIGFGFTSSILQVHPYTFARYMSTLDHLTDGRAAWNIVTSYLESTGHGLGLDGLPEHDVRYEMADEYCGICYRLWEDSWADDAVVNDAARGIYADPAKIRKIEHEGEHFRMRGHHLSEPSAQRTPVLFQAGTSERGTDFAAAHGECIFIVGPRPEIVGNHMKTIRAKAEKIGRKAEDIIGFAYIKMVLGGTEEEAQKRYKEYLDQVSFDGALTLIGGWSGVDLTGLEPDEPVEYIKTNAIRTFLQNFTTSDPDREWTVDDIVRYVAIGGPGPVLVGTPEQIADELEEWIDAGADGFNMSFSVMPRSFEDFIDEVRPILVKRGRMQSDYREGPLREKLFPDKGPRIQAPHPAAMSRTPW